MYQFIWIAILPPPKEKKRKNCHWSCASFQQSDPLPEEEFRVGHLLLFHSPFTKLGRRVRGDIARDHEETSHQHVLLANWFNIFDKSGKFRLFQQVSDAWWPLAPLNLQKHLMKKKGKREVFLCMASHRVTGQGFSFSFWERIKVD